LVSRALELAVSVHVVAFAATLGNSVLESLATITVVVAADLAFFHRLSGMPLNVHTIHAA